MKKEEKKKQWGGKRINSGRKSIPNEEKKVAATFYIKAKLRPLLVEKVNEFLFELENVE